MADHGHALQQVVVQLAGHPGPLIFVGGQDPQGVILLQRQAPPLSDDHRRGERHDDNRQTDEAGEEKDPG